MCVLKVENCSAGRERGKEKLVKMLIVLFLSEECIKHGKISILAFMLLCRYEKHHF